MAVLVAIPIDDGQYNSNDDHKPDNRCNCKNVKIIIYY